MKQKDKKISQKIIFLLFPTFFLVGLFTFKDYGISVDEEFQRSSGFYWLSYILSFTSFDEFKNLVGIKLSQIKGFTLPSPTNNTYYGVIFDLPAAFLEVILKIGIASYLPLERSTKLLSEKDRKRISIVGQNFQDADYLYTNFISEVDKNSNDKYKIPNNFSKIDEFILNSTVVYQVFKKNN